MTSSISWRRAKGSWERRRAAHRGRADCGAGEFPVARSCRRISTGGSRDRRLPLIAGHFGFVVTSVQCQYAHQQHASVDVPVR